MIINERLNTIKLEHHDLHLMSRNKPIEQIEYHDFRQLHPDKYKQAAYVYFVNNQGVVKFLKSKRKEESIRHIV